MGIPSCVVGTLDRSEKISPAPLTPFGIVACGAVYWAFAFLAAAFAAMGKKVIQIGCDPKADSTINLLGGEPLRPVMNYMREEDEEPEKLSDIAKEGYGGVLCIETGGPTPGLGCAGRGIIATFQLLEDLRLFETYKPDVVLYDVLGDVVCGGFAAPIREGYAEKVLIVTSGEKMALYAANNISSAVRNFEDRSYARVFGIVLNHRNVENEVQKVQAFSKESGIPIVGEIPRSDEIIRYEDQGQTVIEGNLESEISGRFYDLAKKLLEKPRSTDYGKCFSATKCRCSTATRRCSKLTNAACLFFRHHGAARKTWGTA